MENDILCLLSYLFGGNNKNFEFHLNKKEFDIFELQSKQK